VYHSVVSRLEIAPTCHVAAPAGSAVPDFSPWLEVALRLEIAVAAWQVREQAWSHFAMPLAPDGSVRGAPRRFDPARHALVQGQPASGVIDPDPVAGDDVLVAVVERLIGQWRPLLHRQPALDLVSRLDEPLEEFRRRCRGVLRPLLAARPADAAALAEQAARLTAAIESISLGVDEITVLHGRARVVWRPAGREPAPASAELMLLGAPRGGR
jgi:hypothetical protein